MGNSLLYGKAWYGSNILLKELESTAAICVVTREGVGKISGPFPRSWGSLFASEISNLL